MYINIDELFSYRQYCNFPLAYCFDRETYTFCDASLLESENGPYYERYIPLFRIDEDKIQNDYIVQLNNKGIYNKFINKTVCFEAFIQRNCLWNDWWQFYKRTVYDIAIQWCKDNTVVYNK